MSTRTRVALVVLATGIAGALIYLGVFDSRSTARGAQLPALPDLSTEPAALREHLTDADRAARAQPDSLEAIEALALAYHADMFYEQAERGYLAADQIAGVDGRRLYLRALAQDSRGDAEAFAGTLRRVVDIAPDSGAAWWRLGDVEFKAGRYDTAAAAWRRAIAAKEMEKPAGPGAVRRVPGAPVAAYASLGLALISLARDDADGARETLEKVTAEWPTFGPAFRLLGSAYAALGRTEDSVRVIRIADRSPGYDPYVDPAIDTLVRESRSSTFLLQQAATADLTLNARWREYLIRRALEVDPDNADALYELATLLRVLRRFDEALTRLERHRALVPGDFQALADIGRCLSGLNRFAEAESALREAIAGQDDANTRYDLAFAIDRSGRLPEAVAEYRRALARNPNHRDALNNLAVALARQGKGGEATALFERLVAVDPDNADAHTNLGAMLSSQGSSDRAVREFKAALEINPNHARARDALATVGR